MDGDGSQVKRSKSLGDTCPNLGSPLADSKRTKDHIGVKYRGHIKNSVSNRRRGGKIERSVKTKSKALPEFVFVAVVLAGIFGVALAVKIGGW